MSNTLRLIGRRLLQLPLMILGITFLVFFVMSFSPVDPARTALGETASPEALEAYRDANGLNDPLIVRYLDFLVGLFQGDLGTYSARSLPVADEVARAFPITLALTFFGLMIAVVVAFVIGVLAAVYRDRWPDQFIRIVGVASLSTPSFWLAILLIQLFTLQWGLLPASGPLPDFWEDPAGWLRRMTLPALSLCRCRSPRN